MSHIFGIFSNVKVLNIIKLPKFANNVSHFERKISILCKLCEHEQEFILWEFFSLFSPVIYANQTVEMFASCKVFSTSVKRNCRSRCDSALHIWDARKRLPLWETVPWIFPIRILKGAPRAREKVWCWVDRRKLRANPMFPAKIRK